MPDSADSSDSPGSADNAGSSDNAGGSGSPNGSDSLARRWVDAGPAAVREILTRLRTGRSLDGLGLGQHHGRTDLRGLAMPIPRRVDRYDTGGTGGTGGTGDAGGWFVEELGDLVEFRNVTVAGVDLSGAVLTSARLHGVTLVDSVLSGATCRDWRLWDTTVERCDVSRSTWRGAAIGTWHEGRRNTFRHVDFRGADLRVGAAQAARFEACDFSGATIASVRFEQCSFVDCTFAGPISAVLFDGRLLPGRMAPTVFDGSTFRDAQLTEVDLIGIDLTNVTPPDDPDVMVVTDMPCVARHALAALGPPGHGGAAQASAPSGDTSLAAAVMRQEWEHRLAMVAAGAPSGQRDDCFFNRRDYVDPACADLVDFAETSIRRAQTMCTDGAA